MLGFDIVLSKVFGSSADRLIKRLQPTVAKIGDLEPKYKGMTDEELRGCTADFKQRIENGQPLDDLLPESFGVVREAGRRVLNMRHFDVQLVGGIVLHRGMVAEMKTGEGKTLVATCPVYLNALSGKGVHVVTVNDYLASRDADWMGKIYNFLGLSYGKILSGERDNPAAKRQSYAADITYGTNNEYGFDYLRDNMKFKLEDYVQRGHNFAIVDEVDSILVDEARTPLIISGPTEDPVDRYRTVDNEIHVLQKEVDFTVDEKQRQVSLTDEGVDKVEARLGVSNLYDPVHMEYLHHVNQALKAHFLFKRDKDYVVRPDSTGAVKVTIVDEHTGRLMHGRRWSDGLHQAIEAKERVNIEPESQTYATITFQNFFRMYGKLAGMTGTALTEAEEFGNIYKLEVVPIPTNKPITRIDHHDTVYKTQEEKFRKVLEEIEDCYSRKQPVLVGTTSVEKSELVARLLAKKGIPHEVLNAKQHDREALIVAQAGRLGGITISTNMAGRGTDIKLGGDPEAMARAELGPDADPALYQEAVDRHRVDCDAQRLLVMEAGGLHILGTERHESRRIDNQLRGRSGRQGDPGSSRFYLCLQDDLLRLFGSEKIIVWMDRMGQKDDEAIEHPWITGSIENAQRKVEGHNFNIRKNLLEYDDVMNLQRKAVYDLRRRALDGQNVRQMMVDSIDGLIVDLMDEYIPERSSHEQWNTAGYQKRAQEVFAVTFEDSAEKMKEWARLEVRDRTRAQALGNYDQKEKEIAEENIRHFERMLLLQFADQYWKDHLLAMDRLRDGIGLRSYGQRNPLLEYKKEAFHMYQLMCSMRDESVISRILRMQLQVAQAAGGQSSKGMAQRLASGQLEEQVARRMQQQADQDAEANSLAELGDLGDIGGSTVSIEPLVPAAPPRRLPAKGDEALLYAIEHNVRRNDPCPCGSGQKFKKCCYSESAGPLAGLGGREIRGPLSTGEEADVLAEGTPMDADLSVGDVDGTPADADLSVSEVASSPALASGYELDADLPTSESPKVGPTAG
ncbi:MAG: preprotein translocase subunit SecA [Myxococcales bacterium]|nr:preprotein translocase subunit SecA [Myxococcales bacterium]